MTTLTLTEVEQLKASGAEVLTDEDYQTYAAMYLRATRTVQVEPGFDRCYEVLSDIDGPFETWLDHVGYWEMISPYDVRINPESEDDRYKRETEVDLEF
jgi:hypothetical protein